MEKLTINYSHDYPNDTVLTFSKDEYRSEIKLEFTGDDPDFGTETLICGGNADETMMELVKDQLDDITEYLDATDNGIRRSRVYSYELGDLSNTTLYAFENILKQIIGDETKRTPTLIENKNKHKCGIMRIDLAADIIADAFINKKVNAVYIGIDYDEDHIDNPEEQETWHKIIRMKLPFDNYDTEIALLMGYCGGGNVAMAYSYDGDDFRYAVAEMITESTGLTPADKVYIELIGVNDEHSYENTDK